MARPATGTMIQGPDGEWRARVTVKLPDGRTVRPWYALGTRDPAVAAKLRDELAEDALTHPENFVSAAPAPKPNLGQRFDVYAAAWLERREAEGVAQTQSERGWLVNHINPVLGNLFLPDIRSRHVREMLDEAVKKGLSRQTLVHLRGTVSRVLRRAVLDELISENPVDKTEIPNRRAVQKLRAVPTDAEILQLLDCEDVDLEIRAMALAARCEGGMRTRDVTAWRWEMIDRTLFAYCIVPRTKSGKPQRLEIPDLLQAPLRRWWLAQFQPERGPVFPVTRGNRKGEARKSRGVSFADRLRRAFRTAGVDRAELFEETETTLPVDFHSLRRAFATALEDADIPERQAMALADHTDSRTHRRYTMHAKRAQQIPEGAIPRRVVSSEVSSRSGEDIENGAGHGPRTRDLQLGKLNVGNEKACFQAVFVRDGRNAPSNDPPGSAAIDGVSSESSGGILGTLRDVHLIEEAEWAACEATLLAIGGLDAFVGDDPDDDAEGKAVAS